MTHGDSDHADNAAFLREKYGAKIAIHADDAGMVERGDMGWNRKAKSDRTSLAFKILIRVFPLFIKPAKFKVFKPDLTIDENFDLSKFGLDARVIHLPGHSRGSIGILTAEGDLICGDFVYNMAGFNLINDLTAHDQSRDKLRKMQIRTVYPGHGRPISIQCFNQKYK